MAGSLSTRPDLWWVALGTARRLAAPGWWRRRPYVPLPADGLWAFRMETAYGRADVDPELGDVIAYLEWCRAPRRRHGHAAAAGDQGPVGVGSRRAGRAKFPG